MLGSVCANRHLSMLQTTKLVSVLSQTSYKTASVSAYRYWIQRDTTTISWIQPVSRVHWDVSAMRLAAITVSSTVSGITLL